MNYPQRIHSLIDNYRGLYKALPRTIRVEVSKTQRYAGWCVWSSHRPNEVRIKVAARLMRPDHLNELVLTVLHELIHAEQAALGLDMEHNHYFQWRAREITHATGVYHIYDAQYDS